MRRHVNDSKSPLALLTSLPIRWSVALAYTVFVTILLVQSSTQPLVGPPAPPGPPDLQRELLLTLGHVVTFSLLVIIWWWAGKALLPAPRALFVAVGFALVFGLITELAQTAMVDRQASLFDLAVNWTTTIATATLISERWRKRMALTGQRTVVENSRRVTSDVRLPRQGL
ncbi:MAG: hypothetical protein DIU68_003435 [Chloroflexota bacterium]|nr:MAG: hypothetical protein DIU68_02120 [Chloroflexota bacterium]